MLIGRCFFDGRLGIWSFGDLAASPPPSLPSPEARDTLQAPLCGAEGVNQAGVHSWAGGQGGAH